MDKIKRKHVTDTKAAFYPPARAQRVFCHMQTGHHWAACLEVGVRSDGSEVTGHEWNTQDTQMRDGGRGRGRVESGDRREIDAMLLFTGGKPH